MDALSGDSMRVRSLLIAVALLVSMPAEAAVRTWALVVGVNASVDKGVAPLRYADDDAAKYARLFEHFAERTTLLTLFDAESRALYQDLGGRAQVPDSPSLAKAVGALRAEAAREHAAGNKVVLYFVYVGHGARDKSGEGYVNLVDRRFTRSDLHRLLLEAPADAAQAFDTLHVIVDACSAYFVVHDRGAVPTPAAEDYSGRMGELFGPGATPDRTPYAGFLLATTGDVKVHEWSAWRGGVFSHLVRSGLSGAADVDLDGKVTYPELGAFIAAASGEIKDPRARVDVTVSPPPAQLGAALSDRSAFVPPQVVYLDPKLEGHFAVETPDGERLVDLHKPKGAPAILALWGAKRYFLLGAAGESLLDFTRRKVVAALAFTPARKAERGSVDEEYRRALFARAFDFSYYRAWCSLQRLPAPAAPASSPGLLELGAADPVETPTTPATAVSVRPPVAVLYFDYEGYDDDLTQLRKGLAQMLVTDLVAAGVRVVERERLQEVLEELRLNQTAAVDPATANRVGRLLGARHLVMGHFLESQGTMVVTARVVETETGEIVGESKVAGKPEEFFLLEEQMAAELARGIGRLTPLELPAVPAKPKPRAKPTRQAVKAVAQLGRALEALDEKDEKGARKALTTLLKRHPDFAVAAQQLARIQPATEVAP